MKLPACWLVMAFALIAAGCEPAPPDFSTPRPAAKSFYFAVESGDVGAGPPFGSSTTTAGLTAGEQVAGMAIRPVTSAAPA